MERCHNYTGLHPLDDVLQRHEEPNRCSHRFLALCELFRLTLFAPAFQQPSARHGVAPAVILGVWSLFFSNRVPLTFSLSLHPKPRFHDTTGRAIENCFVIAKIGQLRMKTFSMMEETQTTSEVTLRRCPPTTAVIVGEKALFGINGSHITRPSDSNGVNSRLRETHLNSNQEQRLASLVTSPVLEIHVPAVSESLGFSKSHASIWIRACQKHSILDN